MLLFCPWVLVWLFFTPAHWHFSSSALSYGPAMQQPVTSGCCRYQLLVVLVYIALCELVVLRGNALLFRE